MIKLYGFGRRFGLPDASPFVVKAEVLLKLAGLEYSYVSGSPVKAPKGKLPYIDDNGTLVADTTFIRWHIEKRYGVDFDKGLSPVARAQGWTLEKMCEDHLYWANMDSRWMDDANYEKGPRRFFDFAPAPLRPVIAAMVRRQIRRSLWAHGMGRHARSDIERLAACDLAAIATILGDKPWLLGEAPCGADATAWASVSSILCPHFTSPLRTAAEAHPNLVAYSRRGMQRWFPELAATA